jgi:hypothetical protein
MGGFDPPPLSGALSARFKPLASGQAKIVVTVGSTRFTHDITVYGVPPDTAAWIAGPARVCRFGPLATFSLHVTPPWNACPLPTSWTVEPENIGSFDPLPSPGSLSARFKPSASGPARIVVTVGSTRFTSDITVEQPPTTLDSCTVTALAPINAGGSFEVDADTDLIVTVVPKLSSCELDPAMPLYVRWRYAPGGTGDINYVNGPDYYDD